MKKIPFYNPASPLFFHKKTNIKYILIIVVLAVIFAGGILSWRYWLTPKEETPEKKVGEPEMSLLTTKLATISEKFSEPPIIIFSPDGKRVAYYGIVREQIKGKLNQWFIGFDGKEMGPYDYVGDLAFSPNGKHFVYRTIKEIHTLQSETFFVLDGEEMGPYEYLGDFVFSSDSKHFAYTAGKKGKHFIILDGKEIGPYDSFSNFTFSPDGKRFVYYEVMKKENNKSLLIVDGKEIASYDEIQRFIFSPDSKRFAYAVKEGSERFIVLDGKEMGPYEYSPYEDYYYYTLDFSPDRKHFAYKVKKEGKFFIILDGKEMGPYDAAGLFTFSPDSKRFVYVVEKERKTFLIVNGLDEKEIGDSRDYVGHITLSPDGERFAYVAEKRGAWFVVLDGKEIGGPYWGFAHTTPLYLRLAFSPDSKRFAYIALIYMADRDDYDSVVVLDDKEIGGRYKLIFPDSLTFSPDSKHFAYIAEKQGKKLIVLNGKEKEYDDISGQLSFDPESKYLSYGARIGNELWWIVEEVE